MREKVVKNYHKMVVQLSFLFNKRIQHIEVGTTLIKKERKRHSNQSRLNILQIRYIHTSKLIFHEKEVNYSVGLYDGRIQRSFVRS